MVNKRYLDPEMIANINELKGILSDAIRRGLKYVILPMPVRLLTIDPGYQTPIRTERDLRYLTGKKNQSSYPIDTVNKI